MAKTKNYHQALVLPMAAVASGLALLATWNIHTLKEQSPIAPTRAEAAAWASKEAQSRRCLPATVNVEFASQGFPQVTGTDGPWFATLRCQQTPQIYWRWALLIIIPWAVMTLLARLWFAAGD